MSQSNILKGQELMDVLTTAVSEKSLALMSHLSQGKWDSREVYITGVSDVAIHLQVKSDDSGMELDMTIDQPVGMSLLQGFSKYIFEAPVMGFEPSINGGASGAIVLSTPHSIERMQRRSYSRIAVPEGINVKVLFWHRGYTDGTTEVPIEHYWQGGLMDLSAGGLQIEIDKNSSQNFRVGQIVGLQFTPMPYEKPVVIEGLVKRDIEDQEDGASIVGIEFLGLESEGSGRAKLHRIIDIISTYETANMEAARTPL
jgi:hypothetical protein